MDLGGIGTALALGGRRCWVSATSASGSASASGVLLIRYSIYPTIRLG